MTRRPSYLALGAQYLLLAAIALLSFPFVRYAVDLALEGLQGAPSNSEHLHTAGAWGSNGAIYAHMIGGAVITLLAPLQVIAPIRRRWPGLHRASGYVFAAAASVSALGGFAYIALRGAIGGPLMDLAFGANAALMLTVAFQTVRFARARDFERHWRWALRLFVLALGSWIYRLHYALWVLATDRLWMEEDFSGAFDRINLFAFYVPYLFALELWFRLREPSAPLARAPRA